VPDRWVLAYCRWIAAHRQEPEEGRAEADLEEAFKAGWEAREQERPS
jgi:hypothetical protein